MQVTLRHNIFEGQAQRAGSPGLCVLRCCAGSGRASGELPTSHRDGSGCGPGRGTGGAGAGTGGALRSAIHLIAWSAVKPGERVRGMSPPLNRPLPPEHDCNLVLMPCRSGGRTGRRCWTSRWWSKQVCRQRLSACERRAWWQASRCSQYTAEARREMCYKKGEVRYTGLFSTCEHSLWLSTTFPTISKV